MSLNETIAIAFTYDLPEKPDLYSDFVDILKHFGWTFSIGEQILPRSTCVKTFKDAKTEKDALELAANEIKAIVKEIRDQGFNDFNVERYFILAHRLPHADAIFGEKIL